MILKELLKVISDKNTNLDLCKNGLRIIQGDLKRIETQVLSNYGDHKVKSIVYHNNPTFIDIDLI